MLVELSSVQVTTLVDFTEGQIDALADELRDLPEDHSAEERDRLQTEINGLTALVAHLRSHLST